MDQVTIDYIAKLKSKIEKLEENTKKEKLHAFEDAIEEIFDYYWKPHRHGIDPEPLKISLMENYRKKLYDN